MALNHYIQPHVPDDAGVTVRLGSANTSAGQLTQAEVGKFVKLSATDTFDLAPVDSNIEGVIYAVEIAPQNGWTIGTVLEECRMWVTFEEAVVAGDYVKVGTPVAKGTALSTTTGYPKVKKATAAATAPFNWRVVSLGSAGTGAIGTTGVIARVS